MERGKGFIAAPLLGTLIFLAAVLFVVSVTQVDTSEVARLTQQTYHDQVATNLEDFRSDLGALFSVSVSRAVQNYLTSQCWLTFAMSNGFNTQQDAVYGISNTNSSAPQGFNSLSPAGSDPSSLVLDFDNIPFCQNTPLPAGTQSTYGKFNYQCIPNPNAASISPICVENCNNGVDYYEERYLKCAQVMSIIKQGICTVDPRYGVPGWISAVLGQSGGQPECTFADPTSGQPCQSTGISINGAPGNFTVANGNDNNPGTCNPNPNSCTCINQYTGASVSCTSASPGQYAPTSQNAFSFEGISFSIPNSGLARQLTVDGGCAFPDPNGNVYLVSDNTMYTVSQSNPSICYGTCSSTSGNCASNQSLVGQNECTCQAGTCNDTADDNGVDCGGKTGSYITTNTGLGLCSQLVGNSLFDCRQFAEHTDTTACSSPDPTTRFNECPFRCCSKYAQYDSTNPSATYNQLAGLCCADTQVLNSGHTQQLGCGTVTQAQQYAVPGCEQGNFIIALNTTASNQLYESIPRVEAQDESGNALSGSSLAPGINQVTINYPLYKYLDAALKAYGAVAYGVTGSANDFLNPQSAGDMKLFNGISNQHSQEGVAEGLCYGDNCNKLGAIQVDGEPGYQPAVNRRVFPNSGAAYSLSSLGNLGTNAYAGVVAFTTKLFTDTFLNPNTTVSGSETNQPSITGICRLFQQPGCSQYNLCQTQLWVKWASYPFRELCPVANLTLLDTNPADQGSLYNSQLTTSLPTGVCDPSGVGPLTDYCAYMDSLRLTMELRDSDPANLVNPYDPNNPTTTGYNPFCWYLQPQFYSPCEINNATGQCVNPPG